MKSNICKRHVNKAKSPKSDQSVQIFAVFVLAYICMGHSYDKCDKSFHEIYQKSKSPKTIKTLLPTLPHLKKRLTSRYLKNNSDSNSV